MASLTNTLILLLIVSFGFFVIANYAGIPNSFSSFFTPTGTGANALDYPIVNLIFGDIAGIGVAILAGTFFGVFQFPNPFITFGLIMGVFLLQMVVIPYQTFNALPYPINLFFISVYGFIIAFGLLNWYHGTGEP
jgi:hypothetical protein